MYHLQDTVSGWGEALNRAPNGVLVKAVNRPDLLRTAKQLKPGCITLLRYWYDDGQHYDGANYTVKLARAKNFFDSFLDETFYREYAGYVDIIAGWNEVWAESQTAAEKADRVEQERAMIEVFNRDHKPRLPAHVKYAMASSAVGNTQPKEMYQLSVQHGCYVQDHPYSYWENGVRGANDFNNHSGVWDRMERAYGIKARYVFDEGGPFQSVVDGWRSAKCLGGSIEAYVAAMREWVRDVQKTAAYKEGRVVGPVALFTTGRMGDVWREYWTERDELIALADMFAQEWRPGTSPPAPPPPSVIPVAPISQRDPRWASVPMGDGKSVGSWGCLLAAYNAVAQYWELCNDDPPAFMQRLRDVGAMSGPFILAGALKTAFPTQVKYLGYEGRNPGIRQNIINHLDKGHPVFARVDFNPATPAFEQHWIVLVGYTANDYLMVDPWPYPSDSQPVTVSTRFDIPGPDNNILEAIYYELLPDSPPPPTPSGLGNGSFEDGWRDDGNSQIPNGWNWYHKDNTTPNPYDPNPWSQFGLPECRVLHRENLPANERDLFVLHGNYTFKPFRGSGAWWAGFTQTVNLAAPQTLTINAFGDLVKAYEGNTKVWANDPQGRDGLIRLGVSGTFTEWQSVTPGKWNRFIFNVPAGDNLLAVEFMCPFALKNSGFFLDDWSMVTATPPRTYKRLAHLVPQNATMAEYAQVTASAFPLRQTVLFSIDDAMIGHANLTSRTVYVWGDVRRHGQFTDRASFEAWVLQYYAPLPTLIYRAF